LWWSYLWKKQALIQCIYDTTTFSFSNNRTEKPEKKCKKYTKKTDV
jgi:hypothetical protein